MLATALGLIGRRQKLHLCSCKLTHCGVVHHISGGVLYCASHCQCNDWQTAQAVLQHCGCTAGTGGCWEERGLLIRAAVQILADLYPRWCQQYELAVNEDRLKRSLLRDFEPSAVKA